MQIYILFFALSACLMYCAERSYTNNAIRHNRIGHICSIGSILILCCLAGFRDSSVGIDVEVYVTPYFNIAKHCSSFDEFMTRVTIEPAYGWLLFVGGQILEKPNVILFVSQLLVIGPIFFLIYRRKSDISLTFALIIYQLLFFNMTLCIMRQSIAAAFILLAIDLWDYKKFFSLCLFIVAVLFHQSSIICIPILLILKSFQTKKLSNIYNILILLSPLVGLLFLEEILKLALFMGIISQGYYSVFLSQSYLNDLSILERSIVSILELFPFILSRFSKSPKFKEFSYYALFGFILSFASIKSQYLVRLSYPFQFYTILALPYGYSNIRVLANDTNNKLVYYIFFILLLTIYWYTIYISWNYFGTSEYNFATS